jgi:hypothetical protein
MSQRTRSLGWGVGLIFAAAVAVCVRAAARRPRWIISVQQTSSASIQDLWSVYADPTSRPAWDPLVTSVRVDGQFEPGTRGSSLALNGVEIPWILATVIPPHLFVQVSTLPFARLEASFELIHDGSGIRILHTLAVTGALAWFYELALRPQLLAGMEEAIANLAALPASALTPSALLPAGSSPTP